MIGNDIVDLKHSASNWKRQRFLDKVFTKKEQFLVLSSENQHQMFWLLWSMKEAAYKVYVQQFGERFFNPKRLVCALISEAKGIVSINNIKYVTISEITEDYVYTIANANRQKAEKSFIFKAEIHPYRTQSSLLKQAFIESVSETRNIEPNVLNIKKTKRGVPQLFINSEISTLSFSLTHCGRFSGFAY
ncbi:4'-phosphopantetheinyl transferase superfamily protein [Psychroserpens sp. SPM9]|uniref:4'-phosphopantetheinyl transferase family protein n=1 Tax=Psychroserpens sp. SPM9 TaxID=2975598 RepID=UPI0021A48A4B|nr:4'-phosphopantetheinyl transferase superfamily protein [Psychroserpens sp. SPM9]MDG5491005.1 4'-phosphopantetheinyl transferase superfamily protein [Psychroserpens sp. SPM9]